MTRPRSRRSRWLWRTVALVTGGALVVGALWAFQRQLVYFPDTQPVGPAARTLSGARDVTLRTRDGLELGAWLVPAADEAERKARSPHLRSPNERRPNGRWAVLVLPGNGGNRLGRVGLARLLRDRGLTVLLMDYRGYGGNPGHPSEDGLAADADAARSFLEEQGFPADRTVYLGESLGTGVAAALAARHPPGGVVLRSPFTELADVGAHHYPWLPVRLLLRDRFPVLDHVRGMDLPVVVVRGSADEVVPTGLSARVAAAAPRLLEEVVLPAGHNDPLMFGPPVADAVLRLVDHVERGVG